MAKLLVIAFIWNDDAVLQVFGESAHPFGKQTRSHVCGLKIVVRFVDYERDR